jgi:hypothetical protein
MKLSRLYSHRRALLRRGFAICTECDGDGGWLSGRDFWDAHWVFCDCCDGLRKEDAITEFKRVNHHRELRQTS